MSDRAYIEIEPSQLFLTHYWGKKAPSVPENFEIGSIRIPLAGGVTVPDHNAASGSQYRGMVAAGPQGESGFRFFLTDGVDTHEAIVRVSAMQHPGYALDAV